MTLLLLAVLAGALFGGAAVLLIGAVMAGSRVPEPKGKLRHAGEWRDELAEADRRTGTQR